MATCLHKVPLARERLRALYESDARPWVVAYSGGKDSTAVLQLVYELLLEEQAQGRTSKSVFVISSDTRVEAPNVSAYIAETLGLIRDAAAASKLPLETRLVTPEAHESFWAKLIGLGYPSPTRWFRWCTTSMKIKPSRRAIDEITRAHGSVILLLGTRSDESVTRGNAIASRSTNALGLNRHHEIPDALVATPSLIGVPMMFGTSSIRTPHRMSRRSPLRRDEKSAGPGPFSPTTRIEILERLLQLEAKVGFQLTG